MIDVPTIRAEIEKGVSEHLVDVVMDKLAHRHKNSKWRDCGCSFCRLKREATATIANLQPVRGIYCEVFDRREGARLRYRRQLKEEFEK